nr:glycine-rich protein 1-like [Maniola hyperantus]
MRRLQAARVERVGRGLRRPAVRQQRQQRGGGAQRGGQRQQRGNTDSAWCAGSSSRSVSSVRMRRLQAARVERVGRGLRRPAVRQQRQQRGGGAQRGGQRQQRGNTDSAWCAGSSSRSVASVRMRRLQAARVERVGRGLRRPAVRQQRQQRGGGAQRGGQRQQRGNTDSAWCAGSSSRSVSSVRMRRLQAARVERVGRGLRRPAVRQQRQQRGGGAQRGGQRQQRGNTDSAWRRGSSAWGAACAGQRCASSASSAVAAHSAAASGSSAGTRTARGAPAAARGRCRL